MRQFSNRLSPRIWVVKYKRRAVALKSIFVVLCLQSRDSGPGTSACANENQTNCKYHLLLIPQLFEFFGYCSRQGHDTLLDKHKGIVSEKYQIEQNQSNKVQKQSNFIQS